jgi:phenolic acid decarboxylase
MRLRIDTSEVKFRIAATAQPRAKSRTDTTQKTTPDGRPVWAVKLTATDTGSNSSEMIWVEVAGEEPKLTLDELAAVSGLVFAPWINKKGEIVRNFRADSITVLAEARRPQAVA